MAENLARFWQGRVVYESEHDRYGHVQRFDKYTDHTRIVVLWDNGIESNAFPDQLEVM